MRLIFFARRLSPGGPGAVPCFQVLEDLRRDVPVNNRDTHMSVLDAFVRCRSRPYSCIDQRFELLDGKEISTMEFVGMALRFLTSDSSEARLGEFRDQEYRDRVVSILRHAIPPVSGIDAAAMFAHHPGLVEAVSAARRSDWQRSIGHHWVGQQHASEPSRANVLARQLLWMSRFSGRILSELSASGGDLPRDRLSSCLREAAQTALSIALEIQESCADIYLRRLDRFVHVQDRVPSHGIDRSTTTHDRASTANKYTQASVAVRNRASQTDGSAVRLASVVVPNSRVPEAWSQGLYCVRPMSVGSYLFVGSEEQVRLCGAVAVSYDDMFRILAQHCPPSMPFVPASQTASVALPANGNLPPPPGLEHDDWLPDLSASSDAPAAVPAFGEALVSCPWLGVQEDHLGEHSSDGPSASWCAAAAVCASGLASSSSYALPPTYEAPAVDSWAVVPYPDDVPPGRFDDESSRCALFPEGQSSVWLVDVSERAESPVDDFFRLKQEQ